MKIPPGGQGRLIRVPLGKQCFLLLTWEEYERGLLRGKQARRREANEKRQAKGKVTR